uniref:Zinc finger C2H2 LYAR-type domain-containing protein n=1 Tax=Bionectria ochroleuca TaxID=29856 RepID=A0A8H7TNY6_BIOOC
MVSFSCESCGDILTKKKLDPHRNRCHGATFTCIDCMVHFFGTDYRSHTSCMTEEQKYQGALYKDKNKKPKTQNGANQQRNNDNNMMAQHAYVEDAEESWANYQDFGQTDDEKSPAELLPEAPTPPAAISDDKVDVFEFLVASQTPNASNLELPQEPKVLMPTESTSLVRYEGKPDDLLDPTSFMDDDEGLPQYGDSSFETPAPSRSERKKHKDGVKGDKKRKRLHVDIPSDQDMTDAPPVLHHSGLTGGLKGMMKAHLPHRQTTLATTGRNHCRPALSRRPSTRRITSTARSATAYLACSLLPPSPVPSPVLPKPRRRSARPPPPPPRSIRLLNTPKRRAPKAPN